MSKYLSMLVVWVVIQLSLTCFDVDGFYFAHSLLPKICVDVNNGFRLLKLPWILKVNIKLLKLWPCDHLLGQR